MITEPSQADKPAIVFLLDVDNTLLDNDRLKIEIARRVEALVGAERASEFWKLYENVRADEDYVDFPTTVQRWVTTYADPATGQKLMDALNSLPFRDFVYPGVFDALQYLWTMGTVGILSDGDRVFQPLKIRKSGLEDAVRNNILIYVHKEQELPDVFRRMPADHYVMVDDKPGILAALERDCPTTFTTVLVLQGKYAVTGQFTPAPDYVIDNIAELRRLSRQQLSKT